MLFIKNQVSTPMRRVRKPMMKLMVTSSNAMRWIQNAVGESQK